MTKVEDFLNEKLKNPEIQKEHDALDTEFAILRGESVVYFAVFEPDDQGYWVYFPDLPGCIGHGINFKCAYLNAAESLALHIFAMIEDGDTIPKPSERSVIEKELSPGYLTAPIKVTEWDPDYTKVTDKERIRIDTAEASGFVDDLDIDWHMIGHDADNHVKPNAVTLAAMEEGNRLAHDPTVPGYDSIEELRKALGI